MFRKVFSVFNIIAILVVLSTILPTFAATNTGFNPNGYYSIINRATGKCLDNLGATGSKGIIMKIKRS